MAINRSAWMFAADTTTTARVQKSFINTFHKVYSTPALEN